MIGQLFGVFAVKNSNLQDISKVFVVPPGTVNAMLNDRSVEEVITSVLVKAH